MRQALALTQALVEYYFSCVSAWHPEENLTRDTCTSACIDPKQVSAGDEWIYALLWSEKPFLMTN